MAQVSFPQHTGWSLLPSSKRYALVPVTDQLLSTPDTIPSSPYSLLPPCCTMVCQVTIFWNSSSTPNFSPKYLLLLKKRPWPPGSWIDFFTPEKQFTFVWSDIHPLLSFLEYIYPLATPLQPSSEVSPSSEFFSTVSFILDIPSYLPSLSPLSYFLPSIFAFP